MNRSIKHTATKQNPMTLADLSSLVQIAMHADMDPASEVTVVNSFSGKVRTVKIEETQP